MITVKWDYMSHEIIWGGSLIHKARHIPGLVSVVKDRCGNRSFESVVEVVGDGIISAEHSHFICIGSALDTCPVEL